MCAGKSQDKRLPETTHTGKGDGDQNKASLCAYI